MTLHLRSLALTNNSTNVTDIVYQKYLKYLLPYQSHLLIDSNFNTILPANPSDIFSYNSIVNEGIISDPNYNADIIQPYLDKDIFSLLNIPTTITTTENTISGILTTLSPTITDNTYGTIANFLANTNFSYSGFKRNSLIYFSYLEQDPYPAYTLYLIVYDINANTLTIKDFSQLSAITSSVAISNPIVDSNNNIFVILDTTNATSNFGLAKFTSTGTFSFTKFTLPSGMSLPPAVDNFIIDSQDISYIVDFSSFTTEVNIYSITNTTLNTARTLLYINAATSSYNSITNQLILSDQVNLNVYDFNTLNLITSDSSFSLISNTLSPSTNIVLGNSSLTKPNQIPVLNYSNGASTQIIEASSGYGVDGDITSTGTIAIIAGTIQNYDNNTVYFLEANKVLG